MIKSIQITILILVSSATFLTGAGATMIRFCCTSCSGQTLFITQEHICCGEKQKSDSPAIHTKSCCQKEQKVVIATDKKDGCNYTQNNHCTAFRISVDIDASSFRPHIANPFVWISDVPFMQQAQLLPYITILSDEYSYFSPPPNIPPKEYLSLIRILII